VINCKGNDMTEKTEDLYTLTHDAHHAAEATTFGARYASGTLSRQEYALWLGFQLQAHDLIDAVVPGFMGRRVALAADLLVVRAPLFALSAGYELAAEIMRTPPLSQLAAAYIFYGAHLQGGAVIKPKLIAAGLPTTHLDFGDSANDARKWLKELRTHTELAPAANAVFGHTIDAMNEISQIYNDSNP
jgi:hypothetical protein